MRKLKLISNRNQNYLEDVGGLELLGEKITIHLKPYNKVILNRGGIDYTLLETTNEEKTIAGKALVGDIYKLGLLEIKVDEEANLFLPQEQFNEAIPQGKKTTLTAGIILLILLVVSVVLGVRQKGIKDFEQKALIEFEKAKSNYDEAIKIFETDKQRSRELFLDSKNIVYRLVDAKYKNDELNNLLQNIKDKEIEILGEVKVDIQEFLDLTLQINDFKGVEIASTGEEMYIWDKDKSRIIKVNIDTKKAEIIGNEDEIKGTKKVISYEDRVFLAKEDGLYELTDNNSKKIENDFSNSYPYAYAGNIYEVKKGENKILRYNGSSNGFGNGNDWLAPGIEADFSNVVDISIDGSIWLLSSTGKVSKFTNGNSISLGNIGMPKNLNNPKAIYANEKLKYVYILDGEAGRIVVLDKTGKFVMQYLNDGLKNATDLVVSEENKRAVVLMGTKLMWFEVK